jgi:hypothetical protein
VTNATGGNASSSVQVTVKPAAPAVSLNPVANAGGSQTLTLPANSTTLNGTASYNPAGGSLTYTWSRILGPSSFSISGANTATPNVSGLAKGVYQIGLTVTNAAGISASDVMTITVSTGPVPVAKVGADTTVSFPNGFALLHDAGSYAIGGASIVSYWWKEISGPTIAMFGNDTMSFSSAGNLEPGDYIFELTVTDNNGLSGSARMKVSVVNTFRIDKMISVYPNPCRDQLHIRLITDSTGPMTIRITSLAGVIVFTGSYQKNQLQVDEPIPVGRLAQGMYVVEVIIGNRVQLLTKFVKQ